MKMPMGPPPPRNPVPAAPSEAEQAPKPPSFPLAQNLSQTAQNEGKIKVPMGPPPLRNIVAVEPEVQTLNSPIPTRESTQSGIEAVDTHVRKSEERGSEISNSADPSEKPKKSQQNAPSSIPYSVPSWSEPPCQPYFLEVLKDGIIIEQLDVSAKGAFMFGRVDLCDFVLEHPSISRFHAVLQYKGNGDAFMFDLGSTHGTFINKSKIKGKAYKELHVGDVIRFGLSTRLYIFQGPSELMLPEGNLKRLQEARNQQDAQDREASLLRARLDASLADGISWGIAEDAIEEATEDNVDTTTWQTYKGKLTEKQEKTRDKIIKRTEKVGHMKKEIDAIKAKEIAQGGLTQGQQTQIARNEQRISQIMEELENLEETLNESIQESMGARGGKRHGKIPLEDEDEVLSDDDEFYDRTQKKPSSLMNGDAKGAVETAETLLDKKESITKNIEELKNALQEEKCKATQGIQVEKGNEDALDAFMSGISTQIELDAAARLEKRIRDLESEQERIIYLLKIADPTGEASKKRDPQCQPQKPNSTGVPVNGPKRKRSDEKKSSVTEKTPAAGPAEEIPPLNDTCRLIEDDGNKNKEKASTFVIPKPRWLGATQEVDSSDSPHVEIPSIRDESNEFVDYKDRKTVLTVDNEQKIASSIEDAAPGLIIRKQQEVGTSFTGSSGPPTSAENDALDAVALLLKHQRGFMLQHDDEIESEKDGVSTRKFSNEKRKQRKTLGPEKPGFLDTGTSDYDSWVPPEGQTGDGRTKLNERFGY